MLGARLPTSTVREAGFQHGSPQCRARVHAGVPERVTIVDTTRPAAEERVLRAALRVVVDRAGRREIAPQTCGNRIGLEEQPYRRSQRWSDDPPTGTTVNISGGELVQIHLGQGSGGRSLGLTSATSSGWPTPPRAARLRRDEGVRLVDIGLRVHADLREHGHELRSELVERLLGLPDVYYAEAVLALPRNVGEQAGHGPVGR